MKKKTAKDRIKEAEAMCKEKSQNLLMNVLMK